MRLRIGLIGMSLLLFIAVLSAQKSGDDLFQQGTGREAKGDNLGAIKLYERIVKEFASNHSLAAKATIHLARLSDVQGQEAARQYYDSIIKNYPDQTASVAEARKWIDSHATTGIEIATPFTKDPWSFAISPDGKSLVFLVTNGATSALWLRRLDTDKQGPIPGTESSRYSGGVTGANPFWSPDGRFIGYFEDQKLKTISVAGGSPMTLAPAPANTGGTWSVRGDIVFAPNILDSPLFRVSDRGGEEAVRLTELDSATRAHRFPRFLTDGRHFLIYLRPKDLMATAFVTIGSIDGEMESLPLSASAAAFAPPNRLVFVSGGALQFQEFDLRTMKMTSSPVVLDERIATFQGNSGAAAFSVSKTGVIAYRRSTAARRHVIWRDAMGNATSIGNQVLTTSLTGTPRFSPNKRDVLFARNDQGELTAILDTASGQFGNVQVGLGVLSGESPIWSPDGTSFLLAALGGGRTSQLFEQRANAAPSSHIRILNSDETNIPTDWRNEFRLFNRTSLTTSLDVMLLPVPNGSEPIQIAATAAREANGRFSPDSKWIVYESDQLDGRNEIFVQPFPGTISDRRRVSNNGGANAQWSWDGTSVYFLSKDSRLMAAGFKLSADGRSPVIGDPVPLFSVPEGSTYAPASDGRFLMLEPTAEIPPIIVLQNPFGVTH